MADAFSDFIEGNVPEVLMIIAGLFALLIVYMYRTDKESGKYRAVTLIGAVVGILIILVALTRYKSWSAFDAALVLLAGFALLIRPITKINVAVIVALVVMGIVYLCLGQCTGNLSFLAEFWPRLIISLIIGALIFMILSFLQAVVLFIGKFVNCWPILAVLGVICIVEGVLLLCNQPSIFNLITGH